MNLKKKIIKFAYGRWRFKQICYLECVCMSKHIMSTSDDYPRDICIENNLQEKKHPILMYKFKIVIIFIFVEWLFDPKIIEHYFRCFIHITSTALIFSGSSLK